jgi:hypothetical protein
MDFVVLEIGGDERAPIILGRPFMSTMKASSTWTVPRSVSPSRRRRSSRSKTTYYILPLIHRRRTCSKRQQQWPRRRTKEGGRIRQASHLRRLST